MNVSEYLLESRVTEDREALLTLAGSYTRSELRSAADKVAHALYERGVGKGAPVLLQAENSFFWIACYLGILKVGAVAVPLPGVMEEPDLSYIVASTQAQCVCVQAKFAARLLPMVPPSAVIIDGHAPEVAGPTHQIALFEEILRGPGGAPCEPVRPGDQAAIMFTSGSTGQPRGVIVSHRNIAANTESIIQYLELAPADRIMVVLPFFYCYGTSLLHTHLRVGGSLVLDSRFMFPDKVLQRMIETGCTGFAGVPSHYQILLRSSSLRKLLFPKLRYVQQAGGHLPPVFVEELRHALPTTKIFIMYGQTEATARLSYLPPDWLNRKLGSIGRGIPGVRLMVQREDGSAVRPGEVGEIVAEGDNVTVGYWRDSAESAATFRAGKLHTGDLATVDEDGFIYIVDRATDFLKCGGNRVSCRRVEEMLMRFPDLLEAAVVGVPDDTYGEAVKVFVVPRPESERDIRARLASFCTGTFPSYLVPKEIVVMSGLPKNSAGKVARAALKTRPQSA